MNPIYQQSQNAMQSQFNQFKKTINGDPEAIVKGLINSGKMTQQQFNELSQKANVLSNILK